LNGEFLSVGREDAGKWSDNQKDKYKEEKTQKNITHEPESKQCIRWFIRNISL
jgi:hypothetical protein